VVVVVTVAKLIYCFIEIIVTAIIKELLPILQNSSFSKDIIT